MATSIFFNGRVVATPGSYTEVDASGLEQVGLGASGIVAVLGTAEGGRPASTMSESADLIRITRPETVRRTFRSGDLREACAMLFEPSRDPGITAGAQQVVAMKVNPALQSTATLSNGNGPAIDLTSVDYGAFTTQINVSVANGTNQGKLITIRFEDELETKDDLGGSNIFTLQYDAGASGYSTMLGSVSGGGAVSAVGTKTAAGDDTTFQANTPIVPGNRARVVSTSAGDTTQTVTIYGLNGSNATQSETLSLAGLTPVSGTATWNAIYGMEISAAHAGTVEVRDDQAALFPIIGQALTGTLVEGVTVCSGCPVSNSTLSVGASPAGIAGRKLLVFGKNSANAAMGDVFTMIAGTGSVAGAASFAQIDRIVTGDLEAARTATVTATAVASSPAVQTTIKKVADLFNSRRSGSVGFVLTLVTGNTSFDVTKLDQVSSVNVNGIAAGFKADLYAIIDWINQNSQLVTAEKATGAIGVPSNTTQPMFLSGGSEGTATANDYLSALNLLKKTRINSVVVLTGDPSVHADLAAHCDYMCGIGRSERDGFVGLLNTGLDDVPSKTELKAQIVDLNTRHIRTCAQAIERFSTSGDRTTFLPPFQAVIAAGMQAGSTVGTSLTFKYANVLGVSQHSSWNPVDDSEELIQAGLLFMENVDGVGRRWVRNVTTHLSSDNIAFTEGSVNQAVNYATYTLRNALEFAVGKKGFSGTINAVKATALNILGQLVDANIIVAYRALDVTLNVDVMEVSVELAPVIPVNFVHTVVHLVTVQQRAA